jgi:hypothetical protein
MRRVQDTASNRSTGGAVRARVWRRALAAGVLAGWCGAVSAQTFYRWTDDRGIVHLADQPPPNFKGVEERHLVVPPPAVRQEPADAGEQADASGSDPALSRTPPAEGPAKVIVVSRHTPRIGPSALHVTGEVKNVGGKDAQQVVVSLNALDESQGTLCLQSEAAVAPSTLHPGEKGSFETTIDGPCLYEDTGVEISPAWE